MVPAVSYYAELLLNIRTVTVSVSLPSALSEHSRATLETDCKTIVLVHQGQRALLTLPVKVARPKDGLLTIPVSCATSLNLRFHPETDDSVRTAQTEQTENTYPWNASTMHETSALTCRVCRNTFVAPDTLREWKNLPSENWAEMMDFWHCHKPHVPEVSEGTKGDTAEKGYAASSYLTARPGVGFVDVLQFLLYGEDCVGLKVCKAQCTN